MLMTLFIRPVWKIIGVFVPDNEVNLFPLSGQLISPQAYGHYLVWFIQSCFMAYMLGMEEKVSPKITACFFWLWVAQTVSYLLFYKLELDYYKLITINTVGFGIFAYVAWRYGRIDSD